MAKKQSRATRLRLRLIPKSTEKAKASVEKDITIPDSVDGKKILEGKIQDDAEDRQ